LDIEKLKKNLPDKNIIYYETIDSTQKKARELIKKNIADKTVLIADNQTDGIGTHGRIWHTDGGNNILMTLIYYPNCSIKKLETITIDISNCIVDTIRKMYKIKLDIKKPNDIILKDKKLGGILTETITYKDKVKVLLIGIGININQTMFSDEIKDVATSLKKETGRAFEREEIIINILNKIEKTYEAKIM